MSSPAIKPSRSGRWRAAVLIAVHLLVAIHIAIWWAGRRVMTPLEPSEAMQFAKDAIVNAGLIFFGLTIASTAILGRWFCGWACHVVALQDFSRWVLGKVGVKPRPVRSRLLGLVPLIAFVYMFLAPFIYRGLARQPDDPAARPIWSVASVQLTTNDFWKTFPGWLEGALTFLCCGFAAVYLLGAKGFCTNGCPYGAIFGIADQIAPLRIRVTDDCEQCGHCTAVCSSNVRVHEEVRDFKMVVDPGCMKCLDCVSVCPNDALYVGWGAPALGGAGKAAGNVGARLRALAPAAIFVAAGLTLFVGFDLRYALDASHWLLIGLLTALVVGVVALFDRSAAAGAADMRRDVILGVAFLGAVFAFRHLYGFGAFLFSLGVGGCAAFLTHQFVELIRTRDVTLRGWVMKSRGIWRPAGYAFTGIMLPLFVIWIFAGAIQVRAIDTDWTLARTEKLRAAAETGDARAREQLFADYLKLINREAATPEVFVHGVLLLSKMGDVERARAWNAIGVQRFPENPQLQMNRGFELAMNGELEQAANAFQRAVNAAPKLIQPRLLLAQALCEREQWQAGIAGYDAVLTLDPNQLDALLSSGLALAQIGQTAAGLQRLERAHQLAPNQPDINEALARVRALASQPAAP